MLWYGSRRLQPGRKAVPPDARNQRGNQMPVGGRQRNRTPGAWRLNTDARQRFLTGLIIRNFLRACLEHGTEDFAKARSLVLDTRFCSRQQHQRRSFSGVRQQRCWCACAKGGTYKEECQRETAGMQYALTGMRSELAFVWEG